jgi:hypothetical protein
MTVAIEIGADRIESYPNQRGLTARFSRDGAEVSDLNEFKNSFGSNCPIAFQSVSERLPKPALKATKAEHSPPILQTHRRRPTQLPI